MLLVIDVGNTNITFGLFDGSSLVHQFRAESARQRTADEYAVFVRQVLAMRGVASQAVSAAIIASVVPVLTDAMIELVRHAFAREPLVVGPGIKTGISVLTDNPREVGADRIVNSVAAFDYVKGGAIVVDFGTATTFDCVTPRGEYVGGCIAPGLQISAEALFSRASKLHRVDVVAPPRTVGRSSAHAMQAGIVFGYAGLVDGLVARLREELGFACMTIATGGLARLIASHARGIDRVDDALTLEGLRILHERNASPSATP